MLITSLATLRDIVALLIAPANDAFKRVMNLMINDISKQKGARIIRAFIIDKHVLLDRVN